MKHLWGRERDVPFEISSKGGYPSLKAAIGPEIMVSGRVALGILVDANDDPDARWDEVKSRLKRYGCDLPRAAARTGTIVDGSPRVGVWLMPDNESSGELEDFIEQLIPPEDKVWPRAVSYIDGIPENERRFASGKIQRARIHAWLAARKEPRKMGAAIRAGDLDRSAPYGASLRNWLEALFGEAGGAG